MMFIYYNPIGLYIGAGDIFAILMLYNQVPDILVFLIISCIIGLILGIILNTSKVPFISCLTMSFLICLML